MDEVLITVIVAAYNAQDTIERCIRSIESQTINEIQVLVIDDGSKDNTRQIVDGLCEKDKRIKCISQTNQGISAVRERGIRMATGVFSIFVDADDWLDPEALSTMYKKAIAHSADMTICDFWIHDSRGIVYDSQQPTPTAEAGRVFSQMLGKLHGSLCNKLIRTELYSKYNIHFPDKLSWGEDLYVCLSLLSCGIKVCHVPAALYHYDKSDEKSLTGKWYDFPMAERVRVLHLIEPLVSQENQGAFSDYVARIAYDALFCKKKYCANYRVLFGPYKHRIIHSNLPFKKRFLVFLRFMGFLLPLRQIRQLILFFK